MGLYAAPVSRILVVPGVRDAPYALLFVYPMAKFPLGQIYIAPEATHKLTALGRTAEEFLARHQEADWGDNAKIQRTSAAALARRSLAQPLLSFYSWESRGGPGDSDQP